MDSSPLTARDKTGEPSLPSTAGVKRPAPSLLPAFEPLSSSPTLPRPAKRRATGSSRDYFQYPTPVPTSSTGILSSSPPRLVPAGGITAASRSGLGLGLGARRPAPLCRTQSGLSERAPLSAVPSVALNENGETVLMGRSSNSSHYQLSANRLISRIHVRVRYVPATEVLEPNKIEIVCSGWNGLKLHCQGRTWDLAKGDTFTSETEGAEIMIDVQDARVRVHWPRLDKERGSDGLGHLSDSSWDTSPQPSRTGDGGTPSRPSRRARHIQSPESPSPANGSTSRANLHDLMPHPSDQDAAVQIYEDPSVDEQELPKMIVADPGESMRTEVAVSFSSDLSDPLSDGDNDPDEENDPIVHSFGPFGANLSNRLASFSTTSPKPPRVSRAILSGEPTSISSLSGAVITTEPPQLSYLSSRTVTPEPAITTTTTAAAAAAAGEQRGADSTPPPKLSLVQAATIANHVVNQLAFSRLSSTPLSTILRNLPAEEKEGLGRDGLRAVIETVACIGMIERQGKDAAGQPLESEYYYMPEMDADEQRRLAVTDGLRKPSLRNCRKQHKQYYWKRPRTP